MTDFVIDDLTPRELAMVVELQQVELKRLLGEHRRLNDRIDQLMQLQEREQVLRQQMQAALDRLAEQRAVAPPEPRPVAQIEDRLHRAESRYNALRNAVGLLVGALERRERQHRDTLHADLFAPDAPDVI